MPAVWAGKWRAKPAETWARRQGAGVKLRPICSPNLLFNITPNKLDLCPIVAMLSCMDGPTGNVMQNEDLAADSTMLRKLRVFIVEDELVNLELYRSLLRVLSDRFLIYPFTNGDEAWAAMSNTNPDILLTDLLHPGLDGWKLLDLLAAAKARFPVLVVSGDVLANEHILRQSYPGLDIVYLGKPFDLGVLHQYFSSLLNREKGPSTTDVKAESPAANDRPDQSGNNACPPD